MFRRRTDKVYATLQQVQRRLTQGTEQFGPPAADGAAPAPAPVAPPLSSVKPTERYRSYARQATALDAQPGSVVYPPGMRPPVVSPGSTPPASSAAPSHPAFITAAPVVPGGMPPAPVADEREMPPPPVMPNLMQIGARKRGIWLSQELAGALVVVWLATIGVAFMLGYRPAPTGQVPSTGQSFSGDQQVGGQTPVETVSPGDADRTTGAATFVILLKSIPGTTTGPALASARATFEDQARKHNKIAVDSRGQVPPWFGVRAPKSGGLQYVYGFNEGRFGIARDAANEQVYAMLQRDFPQAKWVNLAR